MHQSNVNFYTEIVNLSSTQVEPFGPPVQTPDAIWKSNLTLVFIAAALFLYSFGLVLNLDVVLNIYHHSEQFLLSEHSLAGRSLG